MFYTILWCICDNDIWWCDIDGLWCKLFLLSPSPNHMHIWRFFSQIQICRHVAQSTEVQWVVMSL